MKKDLGVKPYTFPMPVLMISGDMDPVGDYGEGVKKVFGWIKEAGVRDAQLKLYPGARHEVLNETNRAEVYADVAAWLEDKFPARGAAE